ncbi:unnamed protein product [Symbiodinium sp. CCMP2592]|nr:unnamed protein product [Symbiodinium sp. CCMP2592]
MQRYLCDLGFTAPDMYVWKREDFEIKIPWSEPGAGPQVTNQLKEAMLKDRWQRIASQESAAGCEEGIDWTVPRKMLKQASKRPLVASGLRMLCQGAIRRAGHGGDLKSLFTGEHLPDPAIFFGTDASGGTMTGSLQIGSTVNDGEQVAINQLAEWTKAPIRSSSDSKMAIKRCLMAKAHEVFPQLWSASQEKRELVQLEWTKGHLDEAQHCQRFGKESWWTWATNLEADMACNRKSAEVFSHEQAYRTDCIDQVARAKVTSGW